MQGTACATASWGTGGATQPIFKANQWSTARRAFERDPVPVPAPCLRHAGRLAQGLHTERRHSRLGWAYDAPVDLIYGRDSVLNPYRKGGDPSEIFAASYPQGYASHFIEGTHGAFFQPQTVGSLATVLRGLPFPGDTA